MVATNARGVHTPESSALVGVSTSVIAVRSPHPVLSRAFIIQDWDVLRVWGTSTERMICCLET